MLGGVWMGCRTPEEAIESLKVEAEEAPEIVDDFDVGVDEPVDIKDRDENLMKLRKRVEKKEVKVLNAPRAGKKLLVLDIDYTLFDHRSPAETPAQLMRPHLHEFLVRLLSPIRLPTTPPPPSSCMPFSQLPSIDASPGASAGELLRTLGYLCDSHLKPAVPLLGGEKRTTGRTVSCVLCCSSLWRLREQLWVLTTADGVLCFIRHRDLVGHGHEVGGGEDGRAGRAEPSQLQDHHTTGPWLDDHRA